MKKLKGIFCSLSLLVAASSFTVNDDAVSAKVKTAFEKTFVTASDVNWRKEKEFYLVSFKENNQDFSAAFSEEGELMSATRNISLSQLPLSISLGLQDKYKGYTIDNMVTELTVNGASNYYLKAENSKYLLTIKGSSSGELSTENKIKK